MDLRVANTARGSDGHLSLQYQCLIRRRRFFWLGRTLVVTLAVVAQLCYLPHVADRIDLVDLFLSYGDPVI